MAEEVAAWRELYNVDGIDLDIEAGAGDRKVRNQGILRHDLLDPFIMYNLFYVVFRE